MEKLIINNKKQTIDSVTRTIRINGEHFDKISKLAEDNKISFNAVVNQMIEYAINNLEK
jgi:predicted HicB family RNase H-like nuclease